MSRNCAVCGFFVDAQDRKRGECVQDVVGRVAHRACIVSMKTLVGGFSVDE